MLEYIQNRGIKSNGISGGLSSSLLVAVRTHQTSIGHLILDCLFENLGLYLREEIRWAVAECLYEGTIGSDLFTRVFEYRKVQDMEYIRMEAENGLAISTREMDMLFRYGTCYVFQELIERGIIQPNNMGRHLPLDRAVHGNRHDLARILLKRGADIDACDKGGEGHSALQYAARRGYPPNVKFLIQNGADPSSVTARTFHDNILWEDVLSLCEKAAAHAQGAKLDEDACCRLFEANGS
jgi:hypothetical protein